MKDMLRLNDCSSARKHLRALGPLALLVVVTMLFSIMPIPARSADACQKLTTVRIQEWPGDIINMVAWVADMQGMFRNNCLDVKFIPLASGPEATAGLVSGSIDFANQGPGNVIRPRAKGVDVRMVANEYAALWSVLVAGNSLAPHLREGYPAIMKELVGKKIGVTSLGGSTEALMRAALEGAGMSPTSVTYISVGGVVTAVPALRAGVVDAAVMFGTGPELAEALGAGRIVLNFRQRGVGPKLLQALYGSTLSWNAYGPNIEKNPEMVAAFAKASNEAILWIQNPKNRTALYRDIKQRMPLPKAMPKREETLKRIVDVNARSLGVGISKASIDGWNKYLMWLHQIKSPIPYKALVWKTGRP